MGKLGRVGIIGGGGWLGSALVASLLQSKALEPHQLACSYRTAPPMNRASCHWTNDNVELVGRSDIIIISVRPADWPGLAIKAPDRLVISVMAGIALADIRMRTGSTRTARALPNAAAEVGHSYTPMFLQSDDPFDGEITRAIFRSCGEVDFVDEESQIDYFTGMTGSGPAFPSLLAEAMIRDATSRGVPLTIAVRAAQQILIGSGRLQEAHRTSPVDIVGEFVEYRGVIAAGITAMRDAGFEEAVRAGLDAALRKSRSLAGPLG